MRRTARMSRIRVAARSTTMRPTAANTSPASRDTNCPNARAVAEVEHPSASSRAKGFGPCRIGSICISSGSGVLRRCDVAAAMTPNCRVAGERALRIVGQVLSWNTRTRSDHASLDRGNVVARQGLRDVHAATSPAKHRRDRRMLTVIAASFRMLFRGGAPADRQLRSTDRGAAHVAHLGVVEPAHTMHDWRLSTSPDPLPPFVRRTNWLRRVFHQSRM